MSLGIPMMFGCAKLYGPPPPPEEVYGTARDSETDSPEVVVQDGNGDTLAMSVVYGKFEK
jgi:hypothetical protein